MAQRGPVPALMIPQSTHMSTRVNVLQARAGLSPGDDAALREFAGAVAEWSRAMSALGAGVGTSARSVLLTCVCAFTLP